MSKDLTDERRTIKRKNI